MKMQRHRFGIMILSAFLFAASAWAHSPRLLVDDLGDGTIYIDVGFSDGSSGAGHKVVLKEKESGTVLSEHTVPAESAVEIPMPSVPYIVVFDAGPGHVTEQEGPFTAQKTDTGTPPAATPAAGAPGVASTPDTPAPAHPQAVPVSPDAEPASPAPVAVAPGMTPAPLSPGVEMAWKMMLITQVISTVLLALLFGAILFWIGYSIGKTRERR